MPGCQGSRTLINDHGRNVVRYAPFGLSRIATAILVCSAAMLGNAGLAAAQDKPLKPVKFAYCVNVFNLFSTPFAVIKTMGFDKEEGIDLEMVNVNSGGDCVTYVSTGTLNYAWAGIEPTAAMVARGGDVLTFYNAYQGNTLEIVVPEDSPIKTIDDLKGKKIGVRSMTALGTIVGRGIITGAGLKPDEDVKFVLTGAATVAAQLLQDGQVDALCIGSGDHARISNTIGPKLRPLSAPIMDGAPSIGMVTRKDHFEANKDEAAALGRMYTKASIVVTHDPEKAVRMMYALWPQTKPLSKEIDEAAKEDADAIRARFNIWKPETSGRKYWGEMLMPQANAYMAGIAEWGIVSKPVKAEDVATNAIVEEANKVDAADIIKRTEEYKVQ
jgi:NitT/TauT family transport system substrate-binding protein